jgi:hypothetical protein
LPYLFFLAKRKTKDFKEVKPTTQQNISTAKELKGLSTFLNIPGLDKRLRSSISTINYHYFSKSEVDQLWIISLAQGTYGFSKAKIAASLKNGQFSMIIASYNYDTASYKKDDFHTYSGTTSIYNQKLKKLWELVYEKGELKAVKRADCSTCSLMPPDQPPSYTDWCVIYPPLCDHQGGGGTNPNDPTLLMMNPDGGGGGGGGTGTTAYDPNNPFADINNPQDFPPNESIVNNGVAVELLSNSSPQNPILIGKSRRDPPNVEDMAYGTPSQYGDPAGIDPYMLWQIDGDLFYYMENLFYWCTIRDDGMAAVGNKMIQKFKDKTGGTFSDPVLDNRIGKEAQFMDYIKLFGKTLNEKLQTVNYDISKVQEPINMMPNRPIFNGGFNKFHGLMITINDTEETDIEYDPSNYHYIGNGKWSLTVTITIHDHFGLDKHDALKFQSSHPGFAAWWILQHQRGYVPFETVSKTTWTITIQ